MIDLKGPDLGALTFTDSDRRKIRERVVEGAENGAKALAEKVREAAPELRGSLRESVRVERDNEGEVSIRAGGTSETQKRTRDGRRFDEALLTEYGTERQGARPFFFSTIRENQADLDHGAAGGLKNPKE